MNPANDVVVIGGGVIGLSTAYLLARDGARVTVLERGSSAREASWAGAGILPPSNPRQARTPFDRLRALSQRLFPDLSQQLHALTGIDNGYWTCGGLEFAAAAGTALEEEWRGPGVECPNLSEDASRRLEPALAPGLGPVCHLPGLAQIRNPRHLQALQAACLHHGVSFLTEADVHALLASGPRIRAAATSQGEVSGERFLLCAGAWSEALLRQLGQALGIRPVRGQIALLRPSTAELRHVLLWGARYLVPRRDGLVLVGSTEEEVGFDKRTTAQAIAQLLDLAIQLVPSLASAEVERTWAGLRPGSPDGLPFLGPVPGWDNVWVGAGHFRAGLQLSPGSALLLKEMLLGQPLSLDAAPFRLDRAGIQA